MLSVFITPCTKPTRIQSTMDYVIQRAAVGNIYLNRNQIGAVVGCQPFGGEGLSGTGFKAGGPHYLLRFMTEHGVTPLHDAKSCVFSHQFPASFYRCRVLVRCQ